MKAIRTLRLIWERVSLYLPVLLMGVLALGTYLLVRNTPVFGPAAGAKPLTHDPDYFMQNFSVRTFHASGQLKSEVLGAEAWHYPDTDTLEIDRIRVRSYDDHGQLTTATANRALTNADASEVQLIGNAVVIRQPVGQAGEVAAPMEFRSEFLHAFMNTEQVKSNKPVELTRGQDRFSGDAMDFDNLGRVVELHGRVKGTLVPGAAR
ncbi:MAG: LPS export ABC transporter periplasmic protein LptC [Rhodoferax sp.]|nr:LPS export ABC transporter periplasmic protein LptC [Rhodoferax sp.]